MAIKLRPYTPPAKYELPPPSTFGDLFPARFEHWRHDQPKAILTTLDSDRRFVAQAAPTGFGKSLTYMGVALLGGLRTVILTSTKGLQEQLLHDFNGDGKQRLVDIRGQNAYRCTAAQEFDYPEYTTCDFAPCHAGRKCSKRESGCKYYDQYRLACSAAVVITNYSYWLSINKYGQGLGQFDLIVLDEAHDAADTLAEFMSVEIEPSELLVLGPAHSKMMDPGCDIRQWAEWANHLLPIVKARIESYTAMARAGAAASVVREGSALKRLLGKLETLSGAADEWVIEKIAKGRGVHATYAVKFDPLWPYKWAEDLLFRKIPKVVLVSATVRRKTMELLGVDEDDYYYYEYDSSFPKSRRPIIHVPTIQMNHRTPVEGLGLWVQRIDQILRTRQDRKGIIHTVSFARAQMILEYSEYRQTMLLNETKNTKWTVERFKSATAPCVLVSPSVTTGYDFPYAECEYQIIGKLPFPDNRAAVIKARMQQDKEFSNYMTMQVLIQMSGRGMRAEDDSCETIVIDDSIEWFMKMNRKFAPKWYTEAIVWGRSVPSPLPKLEEK